MGEVQSHAAKPFILTKYLCLIFILFQRQLTHPNIVKFYGTDLRHGPNGTIVMIVLELCNCSLGSQVMSHPENAPARLSNEAVNKKVLGWAKNILDALQYIHNEGFVHRDLKMDNILVSWLKTSRLSIPLVDFV